VLDARLPARLTKLSDAPEGSRANLLEPDEDLVARIPRGRGPIDILVQRVQRREGAIWVFSARTLTEIPALYEEVEQMRQSSLVAQLLGSRSPVVVQAIEWLLLLVGLPLLYFVISQLNRLVTPAMRVPAAARLLVVALMAYWLVANLPLALMTRQRLSIATWILTVSAIVWLAIVVNGAIEAHVRRRFMGQKLPAAVSLLRVGRHVADAIVVFIGFFAILRHFGVDPTPVLAGLGVGGIAVALAAQKTLENMIAGASLILDEAVRVGDFLRVGTIEGTVDHIGLRSTRIRTLDRSIVSVPNGQIANMSVENMSARDKFWFHPVLGLRYETTPAQLRGVLETVERLLRGHASVDQPSIRVRFLRLNTFSLDVDVFAYVFARDWAHFLEIQEQLLFSVAQAVEATGAEIAFPSQTMYVSGAPAAMPQA
jgi:MscS family membrane protein